MVSTGAIIAAVVCCVLVIIGTVLGVWGTNVACPDFGMDCQASTPPAARTPGPSGTPPTAITPPPLPPPPPPQIFTASNILGAPPPQVAVPTAPPPVPMNCSVSNWGEWTPCSATCGPGHQSRSRTILQVPDIGGTPCPSNLEELKLCTGTGTSCNTPPAYVWQPPPQEYTEPILFDW
jgi:hypothetical protein